MGLKGDEILVTLLARLQGPGTKRPLPSLKTGVFLEPETGKEGFRAGPILDHQRRRLSDCAMFPIPMSTFFSFTVVLPK